MRHVSGVCIPATQSPCAARVSKRAEVSPASVLCCAGGLRIRPGCVGFVLGFAVLRASRRVLNPAAIQGSSNAIQKRSNENRYNPNGPDDGSNESAVPALHAALKTKRSTGLTLRLYNPRVACFSSGTPDSPMFFLPIRTYALFPFRL